LAYRNFVRLSLQELRPSMQEDERSVLPIANKMIATVHEKVDAFGRYKIDGWWIEMLNDMGFDTMTVRCANTM
jgi:hypothetical protein